MKRVMRHAEPQPIHRLRRAIGLAVTGILTFAGVGAATAYYQFQSNIDTADVTQLLAERPTKPTPTHTEAPDPSDPFDGEPLNILVAGSDTRSGEGNNAYGGDIEGMRSDVTMLAHISADRQRVEVVSIPRDSWVDIPSCKLSSGATTAPATTKFNAAFAYGGQAGSASDAAACTIKTVESLTGVYIDGYMVVDFNGFINLIDAVGGVPFYTEVPLVSPKAELDIPAGKQRLSGKDALGVMRARSGEGLTGSDLDRIKRQHDLMNSLSKRILSKSLLTDPVKMYKVLDSATQSLTASPNLGRLPNLVGLGFSLRNMDKSDVTFLTVPVVDRGDGANVVWTSEAENLWEAMRHDEPLSSVVAP